MTDLATLWAELPSITSLRASGDGSWAFWTCGGLSETDELWGAPTDGAAPAARLTFTEDHLSLRDVSPDGGRIILAQSVHANEHDHLLLFERATGTLTRLTPGPTATTSPAPSDSGIRSGLGAERAYCASMVSRSR